MLRMVKIKETDCFSSRSTFNVACKESQNITNANICTTQDVFNILDADGDGFISADEFAYAKLAFLMCCGPDNPIKLFYGPLVEDEEEEMNSEGNKHMSK